MSSVLLPAGVELDDPRLIAAGAPYTFFLPHADELAALQPGDCVKAIFRESAGGREYDAERLWVRIEAFDDGWVTGQLDSDPCDMPAIRAGDAVRIPLTHVLATDYAEGHARPEAPPHREYWERCFVDDCVVSGRSHADYLYREEPDMTRDDDRYEDSGWRIRGTDEAVAEDEAAGRDPVYIAIGKVLNADDRWLHLLDRPIGTAFQWDAQAPDYAELE